MPYKLYVRDRPESRGILIGVAESLSEARDWIESLGSVEDQRPSPYGLLAKVLCLGRSSRRLDG